MSKKILIWDISFKLLNAGGPSGYLYNIHEYLKSDPSTQITFLSDLLGSQKASIEDCADVKLSWFERIKKSRLLFRINDFFYTVWKEYHICNVSLPDSINLNDFDYVHYHQVNDVLRYRKLLLGTKCKSILTTHCPCPRTDEVLSLKPAWYSFFREFILHQEISSYKAADYLMFPCEGAREPYEKEPKIKEIFQNIERKFFYCPSSIVDITIDESKKQKFSEFGIPDDAFVITYFGRHNEIKGYDILKNVGEQLLNKYPHLYFLCAGRGPISPLHHPRWIELGFITNAHELLSQSDLYILPNRETFFDLVVLEILRSGTPLFLAENGGNRYFKMLPVQDIQGLRFFDVRKLSELLNDVCSLIEMKLNNPIEFKVLGLCNRRLWEKSFTMKTYLSQYLSSIENL